MSSAAKALSLLSHFSTTRPEIGLSQLCRLAGRDKATTYRYLQSLENVGFIEKNATTRHYRLGPAVIQLAQIREATLPRKEAARAPLELLAEATGETAHVTVLSGTTVYGLISCESPKHGTRAVIDINTFPLHATASGHCALAFGPAELMENVSADFAAYTDQTPTTPEVLDVMIQQARETGFGHANQTLEAEIYGLSAPLFEQGGHYAGSVSVASVATRFTPALAHTIKTHLVEASRTISRSWGGTIPPPIEALWAKTLASSNALETTS